LERRLERSVPRPPGDGDEGGPGASNPRG
jgi:hypothetical protein